MATITEDAVPEAGQPRGPAAEREGRPPAAERADRPPAAERVDRPATAERVDRPATQRQGSAALAEAAAAAEAVPVTPPGAKHLYLVDGSGYIFRAFHALPPMTRPDGTPVNAVFGFTQHAGAAADRPSRQPPSA